MAIVSVGVDEGEGVGDLLLVGVADGEGVVDDSTGSGVVTLSGGVSIGVGLVITLLRLGNGKADDESLSLAELVTLSLRDAVYQIVPTTQAAATDTTATPGNTRLNSGLTIYNKSLLDGLDILV